MCVTKVYQTETHLSCFRFSLFLSLHSLINTQIPLTSHKQLSKAEKERKESKKERKVGRFFTAELVVLIPLGKSKLILILILNFDFQKQSKANMDDEVVQRVFQEGGRDYFQQQPSTSSSSSSSILQSLPLHVVRYAPNFVLIFFAFAFVFLVQLCFLICKANFAIQISRIYMCVCCVKRKKDFLIMTKFLT